MTLLFLILCALKAAALTDEEVFGPQPADCGGFDSISQSGGPNGHAAKGWATGGIQGVADIVKGGVTGESEYYRGEAIQQGKKYTKYMMAAGTAAANFAGPLAGVGIGILTDMIWPDKTQENNLKKFDCVAKHMERMRKAIHQNAEDIAKNTAAIHQLGQDTANWMQHLGSSLTEHSIVTEWNELITLNDALLECMKVHEFNGEMQFVSTTKMREQEDELAMELFDLMSSELDEDQRRVLKEAHAERRRLGSYQDWDNDCRYDSVSGNYKSLKTRLANMAPALKLMDNMINGGNCFIDLRPFWAMTTLAESMVIAVTQFLLGAKMRGYLSIKEHRDTYFNMMLPKLADMSKGFKDFNNQLNNYKTFSHSECVNARGDRYPWAISTKYTSTEGLKKVCNKHDWCLAVSTIKYGGWLISDYRKVKGKGATTRWGGTVTVDGVTGTNYCSNGCEHATFGGGRSAYRRDHMCSYQGCNCVVKQPIAGKNTVQCKKLKGANDIILKIGDHIRNIEKVVRQTKTNHDSWAAKGRQERKYFAAPSSRYYNVLTQCPEDNKAIYSVMNDENYRPAGQKGAIVGCQLDPSSSRRRRKYGGGRFGRGRFGRLRN